MASYVVYAEALNTTYNKFGTKTSRTTSILSGGIFWNKNNNAEVIKSTASIERNIEQSIAGHGGDNPANGTEPPQVASSYL